MQVNKNECTLSAKKHKVITSVTGANYQVDLFYEGITYSYTSRGFLFIKKEDTLTCPIVFREFEALKFISELEQVVDVYSTLKSSPYEAHRKN